jgi:hypothetical protein
MMDQMNPKLLVFTAVLAMAAGAMLLLSLVSLPREETIYAQWKAVCQVSSQSPFEDRELGIMFDFGSDVAVCNQTAREESGVREVYLIDKAAFGKSSPRSFANAIFGKIIISSTTRQMEARREVVGEEVVVIAGLPTTVKLMRLQGCSSECLIARIAEIKRDGKKFLLEEYVAKAGLLDSFRFIDPNATVPN